MLDCNSINYSKEENGLYLGLQLSLSCLHRKVSSGFPEAYHNSDTSLGYRTFIFKDGITALNTIHQCAKLCQFNNLYIRVIELNPNGLVYIRMVVDQDREKFTELLHNYHKPEGEPLNLGCVAPGVEAVVDPSNVEFVIRSGGSVSIYIEEPKIKLKGFKLI